MDLTCFLSPDYYTDAGRIVSLVCSSNIELLLIYCTNLARHQPRRLFKRMASGNLNPLPLIRCLYIKPFTHIPFYGLNAK